MIDDRAFYMGMRGEQPVFYRGQQHGILFGPSGSGKLHLVVPNLATLRRSVLVIDPKGEACAITMARRWEFSDVYVFNPMNVLLKEYLK